MVDSDSPLVAFPSPAAWLSCLIGSAAHLACGARLPEGKKAYYPTELRDPTDLQALVAAHLAGRLGPRLCLKDGKSFLVDEPFALGRFTPQKTDRGFVATSIVFDIDGPGHTDGLTSEQVDVRTWAFADVAEEAGLAPTVVRSNSGAGRHVIITFSEAIESALALFIAQGMVALIPDAAGTEIFPRTSTLRDGQYGRVIALPLAGSPMGPGGGRIIDRNGTELDVTAVRAPRPDVVDAFRPACERHQAADARLRAARNAQGTYYAHLAHASNRDEQWSAATLEEVVRVFAEIADDRESESHIIGIRCPTHGGTCLHVDPDAGWFYCHKCHHKGAGPGAPFLLLRLLRPEWTPAHIRAELNALHATSARAAGVRS